MKLKNKAEMKSRRRNIALIVSYDGTNYHGFQRQAPPIVAIQNILEDKLQRIFGDTIELAAAGRTDAGVHAQGQVVNFFTNGTIAAEKIPLATKNILPHDIIVRGAKDVDIDFSDRHSEKIKIYKYRIQLGATANPFVNRYSWHIRYPLDIDKMKTVLAMLVGTHDFSAFRAAGGAPVSPIRTIFEAAIDIENIFDSELLTIKIHANGFLYHMARNIVGSLVAVGRGRFTINDFKRIFDSHDRNKAAPTAPPHGLCLCKVYY